MSDETNDGAAEAVAAPVTGPGVVSYHPGVPAELTPDEILWQRAHNPFWRDSLATPDQRAAAAIRADELAAEATAAYALGTAVTQGLAEGIDAHAAVVAAVTEAAVPAASEPPAAETATAPADPLDAAPADTVADSVAPVDPTEDPSARGFHPYYGG